MIALTDVRIAAEGGTIERGTLLIDGGSIVALGSTEDVAIPAGAEVHALPGRTLLPGFLDLHVHGGGGADTMDADPEGLRTICRTHARHGTTGLLPTTMTQSRERISAALSAARAARDGGAAFCPDGAQVLGIHLEGPYICPAKAGAQPREYVRNYDPAEFDEWLARGGDALKLMTAAPEMPGAPDLYAAATAHGIVVSMGHTDATAEQARAGIARGARHATHLFNAMPGIHHRAPGPIPALLTHPDVRVEIIADGHHVAPEVIRMALAARGTGGVILVTDAMEGAGRPDGSFHLGGLPVTVTNGRAVLADGTLAGSVLTMDRAAANVRDWCDLDWSDVARLTATNAADQMGWSRKGRLAVGADADIVAVDDAMTVEATLVAGRTVYAARG